MLYQVIVKGQRRERVVVDLCNTEEEMHKMTVLQLKQKIITRLPGSGEAKSLKLMFTSVSLDGDSEPLSVFGIKHKSVIHIVMRVPGGLRP